MEMEYPLRLERYAISTDSGGPGKYRGGCGVIRDVRLLADEGTFGLRVENSMFPTWGVAGGMGGGLSRVVVNPGHAGGTGNPPVLRRQSLAARRPGPHLHRRRRRLGGSRWSVTLPWCWTTYLDGFVSLDAARDSYGVVINPDAHGKWTQPATERPARRQIRAYRGDAKLFHRFNYFATESEEFQWISKNIPRDSE